VELQPCRKLLPVINEPHLSPEQRDTTHRAFGDCGSDINCWVGFFFKLYVFEHLSILCYSEASSNLQLVRMQCTWVNQTHPVRVRDGDSEVS